MTLPFFINQGLSFSPPAHAHFERVVRNAGVCALFVAVAGENKTKELSLLNQKSAAARKSAHEHVPIFVLFLFFPLAVLPFSRPIPLEALCPPPFFQAGLRMSETPAFLEGERFLL